LSFKDRFKKAIKMSSKIANLIALELGVLIVVLGWLAFSNPTSVKQKSVAPIPARTSDSFATATPALKASSQPHYVVDDRANQDGQPEDEEQSATAQQDDQAAETQTYAGSDLDGGVVTAPSTSDIGIYPEPVLAEPYYFVPPVGQIVAYSQPVEIVVFSNPRPFRHRHGPTDHCAAAPALVAHPPPRTVGGQPDGVRMPSTHQPPGGGGLRTPVSGSGPTRNPGTRSVRQGRVSQASVKSLVVK
jgi:hypothetical protein